MACFQFHSIESQYENCAHLEVNCQPGVLIPNQAMQVDILFYPREARRYHETIPFEINGLSTMNVEIFGEGTDMKVRSHMDNIFFMSKFLSSENRAEELFIYRIRTADKSYCNSQ